MTERLDCIVIGAGVIGLAVARRLARDGRDVLILEETDSIGSITSSRNSEVIHAGIYYEKDSLKAQYCVEGKKRLYDYLESRAIDHERCGKLIVAVDDAEVSRLETLEEHARSNGVNDLEWISGSEAMAMEPELNCVKALLSPSTGIFDSHSFMLSLLGDAENKGAQVAFFSSVKKGSIQDDGIVLNVMCENEEMTLKANTVINASGLGAHHVISNLDGFPNKHIPPSYMAKGNYFSLIGKSPFRHLVYPVPVSAGLGVHYTRDLGGQGRFGPDVQWIDEIDYSIDPERSDSFYAAIRRYWPGLPDNSLSPAYAGIRPKLQAPGEPAMDFLIQGKETHGIDGLVNLFGIESPGLTSSLAIAHAVARKL